MMLINSLRKIKTVHDIRVEKIRLRYELIKAEDRLNNSLHATERLFTVFTFLRNASSTVRRAFSILTRINSFVNNLFAKKNKHQNPSQNETVNHL